jgi:hypothetical protein
MKILGREPTLWIALVSQAVVLIGTFGLDILNGQQAALIVVAINAVFAAINALAVRPVSPVAFTYAVGAIVAVASSYGLNLTIEQTAAISALTVGALALLTRGQVSPVETAVTNSSLRPTAEAAVVDGPAPLDAPILPR